MITATSEDDFKGIRGEICTRREHCDAVLKVTESISSLRHIPQLSFQIAGVAGLMIVTRSLGIPAFAVHNYRNSARVWRIFTP